MQSPVYDPINGDVGAMFPQNRSGVLPPTKGAPMMPPGAPMDDMQRQALVKALSAKIGSMPPQTGVV